MAFSSGNYYAFIFASSAIKSVQASLFISLLYAASICPSFDLKYQLLRHSQFFSLSTLALTSSRRSHLLLNSSITWLKKTRFSFFYDCSIKYLRATASDLSKLISRPSVRRFLYTSAKGVQWIFGCRHYNDSSLMKFNFIF